ncbi:flagellar biosynthetic protein FliO [Niallia sp. Sow4_A1]|uniref:Flagellar biosynthetic protein FliO n=1 Tax=Niallia hominis TaxID=3133173 RepID=A0ABV1ESR3_9BACI|nr:MULTISPECIES: flagellar biosynthetic protein FliO [Bacillaceae]MCF2646563.1 flagellar biosynthetic protein FliO [Niallia circulans]MCM3361536.1 flagellar biosynthetic protein FliO [Niallia sp. MER TA 168]
MNKVYLLIRCSLLIIVLLGFGTKAYAEQIDKSVYDILHNEKSEENKKQEDANKDTTEESTNAEDQTSDQSELLLDESDREESGSIGVTIWDFIKMIFATIFVIFLMYFILRFINKRNHGYKNAQIIENIGGTGLGSNRSIQLIKVGNRLLIVGVGDSIQLIKEIDDEQEYKEILEEYNRKLDQLVQPSDIVTKVKKIVASGHSTSKPKESFTMRLSKELERISRERKEKMDVLEKKKKGTSEKNE